MDGWSIKGDPDVAPTTVAGVTYGLDDTLRSFDSMGFSGWELKFQHLSPDFFSYTIRTKNAKGLGAIVPVDGQVISVFYDGVRKFKGYVVKPKLGLSSLSITAYNAWYFATKIQLTGEADDATGATADRSLYGFPEQGLRTSFRSLINRAEDMGVPWKRITDADESDRIAGMFNFPETTLSNCSFASAIASMMELVGDAVLWFDYDTGTANPAPMISRRDGMTAISYAVGATGTVRVTSAEIYPRTDQKVARVELNHMTREAVTGKPKWASQGFGIADTDEKKRRVQIVTISGPEPFDLLPKDDLETVKVQTVLWTSLTSLFVAQRDSVLSGILKTYKFVPGQIANSIFYYSGTSQRKTEVRIGFPGMSMRSVSGKALKKAQKWLLISPDPLPDWAQKKLGAVEVEITGTWIAAWTSTAQWSAAYQAVRVGAENFDNHFRFATFEDDRIDFAVRSWKISAWVINVERAALTTEYKPRDYDFVTPPAGLAQNLKESQDWLPYEGPVTLKRPDLNGYNGLQRKFNLTNAHPDYDGMDALVRSVSFRGPNTVVWDLGPPPRIDQAGLVNKMRRSGKNNVKWL